jgi:elongation factor P
MISTSDFTKGIILNIDGSPWLLADFSYMNPGKGGAVYRTKLKNLKTGKFIERTFKSGEEFEAMEKEYKDATYLYSDRKNSVFLTKNDKQRISITLEVAQEKVKFLIQNSEVRLLYVNNELLSVDIPVKVELKIIEAEQAVKGNTATNVMKKAKVETGVEIDVPMFIEQGDTVSINTETGEYSERVSK